MKIKYWSGIGYLKKFKYGLSRVRVHVKLYQRTLASLEKWSRDTKVWNMCLRQCQIFHGHRDFRVGYWGANTRTPELDPSTRSSPTHHNIFSKNSALSNGCDGVLHALWYYIMTYTVYLNVYPKTNWKSFPRICCLRIYIHICCWCRSKEFQTFGDSRNGLFWLCKTWQHNMLEYFTRKLGFSTQNLHENS